MIGRLITIGVDGSEQGQPIQDDGRGNYPALCNALGGMIELVPGFRDYKGQRAEAYVNGEGVYSLPPNPTATRLWREFPTACGMLHGPLAIITGDDEFMDAQL